MRFPEVTLYTSTVRFTDPTMHGSVPLSVAFTQMGVFEVMKSFPLLLCHGSPIVLLIIGGTLST